MEIAKFVITGASPLLMHNPTSMRAGGEEMERSGKRIPKSYDEAKAGLYVLPGGGQLYAKSDWFREAGLIAAKEVKDPTKRGRATLTTRFAASVFLTRDTCPLFRATDPTKPITDKDEDWEIDQRRVVVQKQGILRSRPKIDNWRCVLEFEYDKETMPDVGLILGVLQYAGKYPGVGDYRVGKKGPFGRFLAELLNGETP
jgi:hypothetical protein